MLKIFLLVQVLFSLMMYEPNFTLNFLCTCSGDFIPGYQITIFDFCLIVSLIFTLSV